VRKGEKMGKITDTDDLLPDLPRRVGSDPADSEREASGSEQNASERGPEASDSEQETSESTPEQATGGPGAAETTGADGMPVVESGVVMPPKRRTRKPKGQAPPAPSPAAKPAASTVPGAKSQSVDIYAARQGDIQTIWGYSREAIRQWEARGMPRHDDGTYSLVDVAQWRERRLKDRPEQSAAAKEAQHKLELENQMLQARLDERREKLVPRVEMEQTMQAQAIAIRTYLQDGWKRNGQVILRMLGLGPQMLQKLYDVFDKLIKEAVDVWCETAERIK
jgi:hypothetical protein